jgi:hypothetical protein
MYYYKGATFSGAEVMRLLKLALENHRWDLAAHVIVLASARGLSRGQHKNRRGGDRTMSTQKERKRGASKGNQNARKHGFYSKVLDEAERLDFNYVTGVGQPVSSFLRKSLGSRVSLFTFTAQSKSQLKPDNQLILLPSPETRRFPNESGTAGGIR